MSHQRPQGSKRQASGTRAGRRFAAVLDVENVANTRPRRVRKTRDRRPFWPRSTRTWRGWQYGQPRYQRPAPLHGPPRKPSRGANHREDEPDAADRTLIAAALEFVQSGVADLVIVGGDRSFAPLAARPPPRGHARRPPPQGPAPGRYDDHLPAEPRVHRPRSQLNHPHPTCSTQHQPNNPEKSQHVQHQPRASGGGGGKAATITYLAVRVAQDPAVQDACLRAASDCATAARSTSAAGADISASWRRHGNTPPGRLVAEACSVRDLTTTRSRERV